ncbi:hypothetical protein K4L06_13535 [Lysobacter sp. BMK333-48F3]|uniref:hypothetical protein n=1 Tax=Lysobacter sp. BMK333-48F3 TaxID=2867962 RepID=UPI001C8B7DC5|nr:hypothetical protein [Lysobacter sp. BMK333-48F3]MBX9402331.1 hypothetical protein [Lysobacter sp. BMK333-48F3]
MKTLRLLTLSCLMALATTLVATSPRIEAGETTSQPDDSDDLEKKDVERRSKLAGCQLIPYAMRRDNCVTESEGLNGAQACGAKSCSGDTPKLNPMLLQAWKRCASRRGAIVDDYHKSLAAIGRYKASAKYKDWTADERAALDTLTGKIEIAMRVGAKERNAANSMVVYCESLIRKDGG